MKNGAVLALLLAASCSAAASAARLSVTPMARVVGLIGDLESRIQSDGRAEQASYDKYACWCEDTLGRKANDISTAKEQIGSEEMKIKGLKAEIASHGEEIKNLKADIKSNAESQREAEDIRTKEKMDYNDKKTEMEQCIGALEASIKVLTGAGSKTGFLGTLQEAKLISVAAGIRGVLAHSQVSNIASDEDLKLVRQFAEKPEDFMGARAGVVSAAQVAQNPFGDYAPQSTQIQGILKGMYDTFVGDMEKANAEEAESQKAFQELMATKRSEMQTLQLTLDKQTLDEADKTKELADASQLKDDTSAQLEADEAFFSDTKSACKTKALEWSERSRLRTEELTGIRKAIEILTGGEETFVNATSTFVQVGSVHRSHVNAASAHLRALAQEHHSLGLARLASKVKVSGHFDEVIASIDQMIELLRKEEQADIAHRDRCQNGQKKNSNDMADLNSTIDKSERSLQRMGGKKSTLLGEITTLEGEINQTKDEMAEALRLRNEEMASFMQALKDDADSVELLAQAISSLSRFYKRNKIPLSLVRKQDPTYTEDPDKAPETTWDTASYGGRKSESTGIISILGMLKEDLEREMGTSREDDASAQRDYEKSRGAAQQMLDSQTESKATKEKQLSEMEAKMLDMGEFRDQKEGDLAAEEELENSLYSDCSWVQTHFDTRRTKRKTEMDGLAEAKEYLAGVESGTQIAP